MVDMNYDKTLDTWLFNQNPKIVKKLKPVFTDKRVLHISTGTVKTFSPRIPESRSEGEDNITPRICAGLSIHKCLYGIRNNIFKGVFVYDIPQVLTIYELNENSIIVPTNGLTQEDGGDEVWVVPHRLSNWEMTPDVCGHLRLKNTNLNNDRYVYVIRPSKDLIWKGNVTLNEDDCYEVIFKIKENQKLDRTFEIELGDKVDYSVFSQLPSSNDERNSKNIMF